MSMPTCCATADDLVRAYRESGWTARLVPLTVDGLIYASSMAMLDSARRKAPVPALARWLLGLDIAAILAAQDPTVDCLLGGNVDEAHVHVVGDPSISTGGQIGT
jgi:hypothetical protein